MSVLEDLKGIDNQVKTAADEITKAHAKYRSAKNDRSELIYNWILKNHKAWLKNSVIEHNLENGYDADLADNISANIVEDVNEIWISLMMWDPKAARLIAQGFGTRISIGKLIVSNSTNFVKWKQTQQYLSSLNCLVLYLSGTKIENML